MLEVILTVKEEFKKHFSESNLERIFSDHVSLSGATGIDNLNQYAFKAVLKEQVSVISRKAIAGTYSFTKYKLKLISKGRGKVPREISIPTVRDRITLLALCDFLSKRYEGIVSFDLPQKIVREVKDDIGPGKYDELLKRLYIKVRLPSIIELVSKAIKSPTVTISKSNDTPSKKGIPQGLSISNILAAIYLSNLDKILFNYPNASCHRYVDDILIFCQSQDVERVIKDITEHFQKLELEIHDPEKSEKSSKGKISENFDYLGYQFDNGVTRARTSSIEKLKSSLVSIFTSYKHSKNQNQNFLLWRLNLRIAGCIFQNKSKGWLFFFSEITDMTLLHLLDHYVSKLIKRFNIDVKPKKFVRAYHELSHRKYQTNYIPNFDKYDLDMKKQTLVKYFDKDLSGMTTLEIEYEFMRRINKQVKDLLEDVKGFTY